MPDGNEHAERAVVCGSADDKENARLIVSQVLIDTFEGLDMAYPKPSADRLKELQAIRKQLANRGAPGAGFQRESGLDWRLLSEPWAALVPVAVAGPFRIHSKATAIAAPASGPTR